MHQCPAGRVKASASLFSEPPVGGWLYNSPTRLAGIQPELLPWSLSGQGGSKLCPTEKKEQDSMHIQPHSPWTCPWKGKNIWNAFHMPYTSDLISNACRYGRIWSFYHDAIFVLSKTWRRGSKRARIQTLDNLTLRTRLLPSFYYHMPFVPRKC